jgi:hypothetical protein
MQTLKDIALIFIGTILGALIVFWLIGRWFTKLWPKD